MQITNIKAQIVTFLGVLLGGIAISIYANSSNLHLVPLIFIPITYVVLFVLLLRLIKYITSPGLLVVNALYFLRYYVLPLSIIVYMPSSYIAQYASGTWLLLYEEFFAFAAFFFYLSRRKQTTKLSVNTKNFGIELKYVNRIFLVLCLLCFFLFIYKPSLYDSYNLITNVGGGLVEEVLSRKDEVQMSALDNLAGMLIFATYLMLPVYVGLVLFSKYKKNPSSLNFKLALIIPLLVSLLFIVDTDRGGVVHRAATMIFFLVRLYPQNKNKIIKWTYIPAGILVVYMIFSRLWDDDDVSAVTDQVDTNALLIEYLQGYLANIKNCTEAINAYLAYGNYVTIFTPISDVLGNIPLLSHLSDAKNNCNYFYASSIMRNDQVLPLVGNGLFYFGPLLSPILVFFSVKLLFKAEELYQKESNPLGIYVYAYVAIQLAFCHYQNVQLIFLYLTCMIAPIWIIFKFVKAMSKQQYHQLIISKR